MRSPIISLIAAVADNGVIGKENDLPWHLPTDFRYFKSRTIGKPCLMARKTYESLGGALKKRTNIVLTRNHAFEAPDAVVVHSIDDGLKVAAESLGDGNEIMILGGASLYEEMIARADRLYITEVHHSFEGDTTFPDIDEGEWTEVSREDHEADEKNQYPFSFVVYERNTSTSSV
jgi:dihydrofolate reductase